MVSETTKPTTKLVLPVCHRDTGCGLGHRVCLATFLDNAALPASRTANNSDSDQGFAWQLRVSELGSVSPRRWDAGTYRGLSVDDHGYTAGWIIRTNATASSP